MTPDESVAHLTPTSWDLASRALLAKALGEFAHERLLRPRPTGDGSTYLVRGDDPSVEYRFTASVLALDHWVVDAASVVRHQGGAETPLDALGFFLDFRSALDLDGEPLPTYLEEISATLAAAAFRLATPAPGAAELSRAAFQTIEANLPEGHPAFVANSGRIGFGVDGQHRYTPESARPTRLVWLAAHRDHCTFRCSGHLDYDALVSAELDDRTRASFAAVLGGLGLDPDDYLLLPVHPWQWWHRVSVTFAAELGARRLVCLGEGPDEYQPQQSVRTWFNVTNPRRHYVKTALSVVNMGFVRGLSAAYMAATPAINDWVADLIAGDELLVSTRVSILRELASVGYHHRHLDAATERTSPYRKMLAALWRESPVPTLEPGRRLSSMAALLHVDRDGHALAAALIEESGLPPAEWLRRYLDAYLVPLLHCFYAHGLAFMPHGENVILVLSGGVVERVIHKDIAEEVVVMDPDAPLPDEVARVYADVPEHMRLLSILSDVFDGFLRFLSAVLHTRGVLDEDAFWRTVGECAADYVRAVPHLADRVRRYDLFADEFALSCLNRLQLRDTRQMVDLADPTAALRLVGTLRNPIAPYRPAGC
ncbi:IucA/IucC family protein [Actinoalloteichus sp. AHMU CJ021]|uniref:IucA/IucC family protein n=1 Tax=Actinoalloteichus sp. AHMU CJ021 TaxID=2072503 RepID=UPI000CA05FF0|nr:IucA/IucC family protein [Actinoalloteichus sp. AHMU CJ021]